MSCLSEIPEQQIQHLMYGSESLLKTVPSTREERAGNEWSLTVLWQQRRAWCQCHSNSTVMECSWFQSLKEGLLTSVACCLRWKANKRWTSFTRDRSCHLSLLTILICPQMQAADWFLINFLHRKYCSLEWSLSKNILTWWFSIYLLVKVGGRRGLTGTITQAFPFSLKRDQKRAEDRCWECDWVAQQQLEAKELFSGLSLTRSTPNRGTASTSGTAQLAAADSCLSSMLKQFPVFSFFSLT